MKKNLLRRNGFTLIELLVVIAIISLIASIVLASLAQARAQARDVQRISDMRALQQALELYHLDNGEYLTSLADINDCSGSDDFQDHLQPLVDSGYISEIPSDPLWSPGNSDFCYEYVSPGVFVWFALECVEGTSSEDGQSYALIFETETASFNLPEVGENYTGDGYCILSPR